jgi:outer membrane receptor protein involved in Fe transport
VSLQEVVVTAERRNETVQDVPYNITAIDSAAIESSGAATLSELTRVVPGLTTVDQGEATPGRTNYFTLRGLQTDSPGGGKNAAQTPVQSVSSVSTYFGETPVFFPMPVYDIERVEVLRGPQGTLYGSGAQAGTIRLVPTEPKFDKFSGEIQVDASATQDATTFNNLNREIQGYLNVPITNDLAFRLVGQRSHWGGFINASDLYAREGSGYTAAPIPSIPGDLTSGPVLLPIQRDTNVSDKWFVRGALRWQPTEPVSLDFNYFRQTVDSANSQIGNPGFPGGPFNITTPNFGPPGPNNPPFYPKGTVDLRPGGTYTSTAFTESPYNDTIDLASAVVSADVGFATVTSAASYFNDRTVAVADFTPVYYNPVGINFTNYFPYNNYPRLLSVQPSQVHDHSFIEELRLVSNGTHLFDYVLGFYFQREDGTTVTNQYDPGITAFDAYTAQPNQSPQGDTTWDYRRDIGFSDRALFGELTWHVTHEWQVTLGARGFDQTFDTHVLSVLPLCGSICASNLTNPLGTSFTSNSSSAERVVKKANTAYNITPEFKIYATYAEGFRRGGANALSTTGAFASLPQYQTYAPDLAKSYEIGVKGSLRDRMISYSGDLYRIDLDRFQFDGLTFAGLPATYNGSEARSQGAELELQFAFTKHTSASLGYAYTNAVVTHTFNLQDYLSYATIPSFGGTGETASIFGGPVVAGSPLPGVSKNVVTAAIDQAISLAIGSLTLHIDGTYRSSQSGFIAQESGYNWTIPSYFMGNARITVAPHGPLEYSAFIYNFTNNPGFSGGQYVQDIVNYARYRNVARPRTYGISLRYRF